MSQENTIDKLKVLAQAYRTRLSGEQGELILKDLKKMCFADQSLFSSDPLTMARREGKRELWLHIQAQMTKDLNKLEEQIKQMRGNKNG